MKRMSADASRRVQSPRWWRLFLVAMGTVILCSCRAPAPSSSPTGHAVPCPPPGCPPTGIHDGFAGDVFSPGPNEMFQGPAMIVPTAPGMEQGIPIPYRAGGSWAPDGTSQPWPSDEYLTDGGDAVPNTHVMPDWEIRGLNLEDTVAHFDTVDGRTLVEASNRVHVYSPRFGSVRKVVSVQSNDNRIASQGMNQPLKIVQHGDLQVAESRQEHRRAEGHIGRDQLTTYQTRQQGGVFSLKLGPSRFVNEFKAFEDFVALRQGLLEAAEMPFLAKAGEAAVAWVNTHSVQVVLNHRAANELAQAEAGVSVFTVDEQPGSSKLRLIKVASTPFANPGEELAFTLRFDNVGGERIGNVTLVDNLTARLEYIPDSAQCSVDATFRTEPNDAGSQVLRWEITDPVKPGEGGVVRFVCRVR